MDLDTGTFCSKNFKYEDFISCSETFKAMNITNAPYLSATYDFLSQLANDILEPCLLEFGNLQLTYGFCGHTLSSAIKKRRGGIYPPLDQHAGMELNAAGGLICSRGGIAADFHCKPTSSLKVAKFVVERLPFDRLYFYGEDRPIHVSVNKVLTSQIVVMRKVNTKIVPKRVAHGTFLSM